MSCAEASHYVPAQQLVISVNFCTNLVSFPLSLCCSLPSSTASTVCVLFRYMETASQFGSMIEARVGHKTQQFPVFIRMLDKDSTWNSDNGLKTLVPSLLHFGKKISCTAVLFQNIPHISENTSSSSCTSLPFRHTHTYFTALFPNQGCWDIRLCYRT